MTYIGISILGILAILTVIGVLNRVYAQMNVRPGVAFLLYMGAITGIILPAIVIVPMFSFSIGGVLIPFGVALALMIVAIMRGEVWRCVLGGLATAFAVFFLMYFIPLNSVAMTIVSAVIIGSVAGAVGYLIGRSRRAAFVSAVMGLYLAQTAVFVVNVIRGIHTPLNLGTGWVFSSVVLAGIGAAALAELALFMAAGYAREKRQAVPGTKTVGTKTAYNSEQGEFYEFKKK